MIMNRPPLWVATLISLLAAPSLFANGRIWDFLGYTQVDGSRDHGNIQIARRDYLFRTVQVRIAGDAIFFDHLVVHFGDGTDQEVMISGRISPAQKMYIIDLPAEGRVLESVELFYFKEAWEHKPTVCLYGLRSARVDAESPTPETD